MSAFNRIWLSSKIAPKPWHGWASLLAGVVLVFGFFGPMLGSVLLLGLIILLPVLYFLVRRPILVVYASGLLIVLQVGVYLPQAFGITLTPIVAVALLMMLVLLLLILTRSSIRPVPFFLPFLAWMLFTILSYMNSSAISSPVQGVWFIFRMALVPIIVYPLFWQIAPNREQIRRILLFLAIGAGLAGIIALVQTASAGQYLSGVFTNQRWLGILFPFPPEISEENPLLLQAHFYYNTIFRAHGTFYRANGFATFLVITLGLTIGLFRSARGRERYVYLALLMLQLGGLIVTFSRTAWVAFVISIPLGILIELLSSMRRGIPRRVIQLVSFGLMSLLVIIAIGLQFEVVTERFGSILKPGDVDEVQWRMSIWLVIFENLKSNPFLGSGENIVTYIPTSLGEAGVGAHNFYLGVANQVGIPAALIMLLFIAASLNKLWKAMRSTPTSNGKALESGIFMGWIGFLIVGMGTSTYEIENLAILFWLLIAISFWFRSSLCTKYS
jgi:hypothetical protein